MQVPDLGARSESQPGRTVPLDQVPRPVGRDADGVDAPVATGGGLIALSRLVLSVPPVGAVGRAEGRASVRLDGDAVGVEPGLAREEGRRGGEFDFFFFFVVVVERERGVGSRSVRRAVESKFFFFPFFSQGTQPFEEQFSENCRRFQKFKTPDRSARPRRGHGK